MAAVSRMSNPERVVITAVLAGVLDMTPRATSPNQPLAQANPNRQT